MGAEKEIIAFLTSMPEGASTSDIAEKTGHTRATAAKYLELMKLQNKVKCREVGKAKLWLRSDISRKILIAEDEDNIRRLIRVILQPEDYEFIEAKNGAEALEKVSEGMPDLIILDLMMPKVDGIEVCRQLKKNALTRKIPIIMLTAKKEMTDKVSGIKVGADDYLTKPFEPRELRVRVKTFLDKEKRERNPVTNLPTFDNVSNKLKSFDKSIGTFCLFFKNMDMYRKCYGLSKTNEVIRLTSQIITHNLENLSAKNFAGHDNEGNFIVALENNRSRHVIKEIQNEFDATIPFFYDVDYENVDLKNNVIIKIGKKGAIDKMPLIELAVKQLEKEDL